MKPRHIRFRVKKRDGSLSGKRGLLEVEETTEDALFASRVRHLAAQLPHRFQDLATSILEGNADEAADAYLEMLQVRERWLRQGQLHLAELMHELMRFAFVAGADARAQGVAVVQPEEWNEPGEVTLAPSSRANEVDMKREYRAKIIRDGRRRRAAWVTRWDGWLDSRGRLAGERECDICPLTEASERIEPRRGVFVLSWRIRKEYWVLDIGWGDNICTGVQARAFELGYRVDNSRLVVAVWYTQTVTQTRSYAEDMMWLYCPPHRTKVVPNG